MSPTPAPAPAPPTPPHSKSFFIPPPPDVPAQFVYVRIPVKPRRGTDPLHQREDQIDQVLRTQGIGSVLGWGDSLGERRADGSRVAAYIRIDINVSDLAAARTTLQRLLPELDAPAGTEIHYTLQGLSLQDMTTATGWVLEQPVPGMQPHSRLWAKGCLFSEGGLFAQAGGARYSHCASPKPKTPRSAARGFVNK